MEVLRRKYGLWTATAVVVGTVIGSGLFFKADDVMRNTNGSLVKSLIAWLIGGLIMVVTAYCFSLMASRVSKVNGVVDYVELTSNKTIGYSLGWYFATVYYPILVAILGFVSTTFFCTLIQIPIANENGIMWYVWLIAFVLIVLSFIMNIFGPRIAGKFQVSTTIMKLLPVFFIAIVGTIIGIFTGGTKAGFTIPAIPTNTIGINNSFGLAVLATAFAYEGWVIATSINAELKNSRVTLPKALIIGTLIVISAYLLYYIGLSSVISNQNVIEYGDNAPIFAIGEILGINSLLSNIGATTFNFFIVVSCLGTLNGLTLGCCRGVYALAIRNRGPKPKHFSKLSEKSNTSISSGLFGFFFTVFYLCLWYLAIQKGVLPGNMDELAIAFTYSSYLFVFIWMMKNLKGSNVFQRYVFPILAICGSSFLVLSAVGVVTLIETGDFTTILNFLKFIAIILPIFIVGLFFRKVQGDDILSTIEFEEVFDV